MSTSRASRTSLGGVAFLVEFRPEGFGTRNQLRVIES